MTAPVTGKTPVGYLLHTLLINNNQSVEVDIVGPPGSGYDGTLVPLLGNQNTLIDLGLWNAWVAVNQQSPYLLFQLSVVAGSQT